MSVVKCFTAIVAMGFIFVLASGFNSATLNAAQERTLTSGDGAFIQLAQRGGDWQLRAQARFDSMCVYLGLDDKQTKQVKDIYKGMQDEMGKLRDSGMDREAMREPMQKIMGDYQSKLEAILTKDQKAKLDKWNEEHPRRMGRGRG